MKNIERVRSGEGKDVVGRMPGRMKNLAAEIEHVDRHFVFLAFVAVTDTARFQRLFRFGDVTRRLERDVAQCLAVKQSEVVVVGTSQQRSDDMHTYIPLRVLTEH